MVKLLSIVLRPLGWIYGGVAALRNKLFDAGFNSPLRPKISSVGIGNLTVGGTGKTPMAEWILEHCSNPSRTALVSRGYGRKTKGLVVAGPEHGSAEIGDEPAQIRNRFPDLKIILSEKRSIAVNYIEEKLKNIDLIIFDDVFQHRHVDPQLKILLCDFRRPYFQDFPLPAGRLREFRCGAARADLIVVTRCPAHFTEADAQLWKSKIAPRSRQQVLFAAQEFGALIPANEAARKADRAKPDLAFSGIANADSFEQQLREQHGVQHLLRFGDHHDYSPSDLSTILERTSAGMVTTSKDLARLGSEVKFAEKIPLWVLPVSHRFLFGGENLLTAQLEHLTAGKGF